MGFTKLDEGIIYSSLMGEDDSVFKIFTALMAGCKSNGICPFSPVFLSSITKKSIEEIHRCLEILESPDPDSRSITDEGRRIRRVDGGFFLINYQKYRDWTYSDNPEAVKKRLQREKKRGDIQGHVPDIQGHSASASVSVSVSSKERGCKGETFTRFIAAYPDNHNAQGPECEKYMAQHSSLADLIITRAAEYAGYCKKCDPSTYPNSQYIKQASNWLWDENYNIDWGKRKIGKKGATAIVPQSHHYKEMPKYATPTD